jgi:predicted nucleotidyltransferase
MLNRVEAYAASTVNWDVTMKIDLLVAPHDGTTLFDIGGAKMALNKSRAISIDLVTPGRLPEEVRDQVLAEAKPL